MIERHLKAFNECSINHNKSIHSYINMCFDNRIEVKLLHENKVQGKQKWFGITQNEIVVK